MVDGFGSSTCSGCGCARASRPIVHGICFTHDHVIMSVAGATYMFGLYSDDIKSSLGYDQTTLNLLGFFKDWVATLESCQV
jgi:hypothetical protein